MNARPQYKESLKALCEKINCQSIEGIKRPPGAVEAKRHYYVALGYQGRTLETDHFQSRSFRAVPTAYDVLYCMLYDAAGADIPFSLWAGDMGLDLTTHAHRRDAEKEYCRVRISTMRLRDFLGADFAKFLAAEQD